MRKFIKTSWFLFVLLIIMGFELKPASSTQPDTTAITQPGPRQTIRLDPRVRQRYVPPPVEFLKSAEQVASANIVVSYNGGGWTPEAQNAFEFAVGIWETLITSPITIEVDADFDQLGANILGGAGPNTVVRDFPNAPLSSTWYPVATANKLSNSDQDPGSADILATFSSDFPNWHFGTGSSTPTGQISFATVVLHELGHGLGFLGSMKTGGGCIGPPSRGCYNISGYPMIYDRFTENGEGVALLSFPNNSTALGDQLTSENLYFDSPGGNFANSGNRVPIYAPSTWSQGSSYSHLAESFNPTSHALMTFSISYGETIHHPGAVTLCMFEEMGWTVSEACSSGTDTPISGLSATNNGPTIYGGATQLTANITGGSNVSYEWDFGDSTGGSGKSVSHQYTSPGSYIAQVTATNSTNQATASTSVQVEVSVSELSAGNDSPTLLGTPTQLNALVTSGSNVIYTWDFGDSSGGSGASPAHSYPAAGEYTAQVTAANAVSMATTTTLVQVEEGITGLSASNDGPTLLGSQIQFTATLTTGNNVTYEWDFGDGESDSGADVSHQYTSQGVYTVELTATNLVSDESAATVVYVVEQLYWIYLPLQAKQP
ncbi:MAG: PKD domain-containing protein [Anaerolineales bacterium]|nr:PKD domain-containing protein [Anaerolineales bacterium]